MLEAAVGDGAEKLWLQKKVAEAGGVDADVGTLLVDILRSSSGVALLAVGGRGGGLVVELVIRVIDEILFARHVGQRLCRGDATGGEKQRVRVEEKVGRRNSSKVNYRRWINEDGVSRLRCDDVDRLSEGCWGMLLKESGRPGRAKGEIDLRGQKRHSLKT